MKHTLLISVFFLFLFSGTSYSQEVAIEMVDFAFSPADITISEGTTVTWTNNSASVHTSTSGTGCTADGEWDSGSLAAGQSFSMTFGDGSAGAYPYYCIPHCASGMTGSITVEVTSSTNDLYDPGYSSPVEVYPNPFRDEITLISNLTGSITIEVVMQDIYGNILYVSELDLTNQDKQKFSIPTNRLLPGMYIITLTRNNKPILHQQIVKLD